MNLAKDVSEPLKELTVAYRNALEAPQLSDVSGARKLVHRLHFLGVNMNRHFIYEMTK